MMSLVASCEMARLRAELIPCVVERTLEGGDPGEKVHFKRPSDDSSRFGPCKRCAHRPTGRNPGPLGLQEALAAILERVDSMRKQRLWLIISRELSSK